MDKIEVLERQLKPFGNLLLLGAGRLGIRVFEKLVQVHRGGFKVITVFDGGKVDEKDAYYLSKGAKVGEKKVYFLKRHYPLSPSYRKLIFIDRNFTQKDLSLLNRFNVVISTIAGGNTLSLIASIAENFSGTLITTNGVFGFGDETVKVEKLERAEEGPAVFLKNLTEKRNVIVVGTGKLIKDKLPITPQVLENVADKIATTALKILYGEKAE